MFELPMRGIRLQGIQPCYQTEAATSFDIIPVVSPDRSNDVVSYANSILLFSEEKIDLIDKKLSRLNSLVESLITLNSVRSTGISLNQQDDLNNLSVSEEMPLQSTPVSLTTAEGLAINAQSSNNRVGAPLNEITNHTMLDEGQSSLKAHSTFAIDFAHYVVGSSQPLGQSNQEIGKLLDTLHHIRTASNDQRFSSKLFPLVHATTPSEYEQHDMPPLRAAIQLLREAEGTLHHHLFIASD